jgi:hypothetical protein
MITGQALLMATAQELRHAFQKAVRNVEAANKERNRIAVALAWRLSPFKTDQTFRWPNKRLRCTSGNGVPGNYIVEEVRPTGWGLDDARKVSFEIRAHRILKNGQESKHVYYFAPLERKTR